MCENECRAEMLTRWLASAVDRIKDMLRQDDGQAFCEAEAFLRLYNKTFPED